MTPDESKTILDLLARGYPRFDMPAESVSLYQQLLAPLDFQVAERAALEWVQAEKWFPTVAEFREYARKARRELESDARSSEPRHVPDPEVGEMIAAFLRKLDMPKGAPDVELTECPAGECADCGKSFDVLFTPGCGSVGPLCAKCQDARLRVAAKLGASI